jgi:uncharacterized protein (TIGR03437 family)
VITVINSPLCCANRADAPVTAENPAVAGETIYVFATGLGLVCDPIIQCSADDPVKDAINDGSAYTGPAVNVPQSPPSSLAGGNSATVVSASLVQGMVGVYKVVLALSSSISSSPFTQLTISQDIYTSNIVVIPVIQPIPQ